MFSWKLFGCCPWSRGWIIDGRQPDASRRTSSGDWPVIIYRQSDAFIPSYDYRQMLQRCQTLKTWIYHRWDKEDTLGYYPFFIHLFSLKSTIPYHFRYSVWSFCRMTNKLRLPFVLYHIIMVCEWCSAGSWLLWPKEYCKTFSLYFLMLAITLLSNRPVHVNQECTRDITICFSFIVDRACNCAPRFHWLGMVQGDKIRYGVTRSVALIKQFKSTILFVSLMGNRSCRSLLRLRGGE